MPHLLQTLSPRGALARTPYAWTLAIVAILAAAIAHWGDLEKGFGPFWLMLFVVLVGTFFVALIKRLADAGHTRWWMCAPLALGMAATLAGFYLYNPPSLMGSMTEAQKTVAVITILPVFLSGFGQVFAKAAFGALCVGAVWGVFALALLLPGTQSRG